MSIASNARRNVSAPDERGFTLIELLVTAGIFLAIITIVMTIFFNVGKSRNSLERSQVTIEQLRVTLDQISRDVRSHVVRFSCTDRDPTDSLSLVTPSGAAVTYAFEGGSLLRREEGRVEIVLEKIAGIDVQFLISRVNVLSGGISEKPPLVTTIISMNGTNSFSLQSTATTRLSRADQQPCI